MSIARLEHCLFLEQVRATVLDAVRTCGQPRLSVAEEAGVSTRVLLTLLKGGTPAPASLGKLDAWCEAWGRMGAWAEQAALALIVSGLPLDDRLNARAEIAQWVAERLTRAGQPVPPWVEDELKDFRFLTRAPKRPESEVNMAATGLQAEPTHDPNAAAALNILAGFFPERERLDFKLQMARSMADQLTAMGEPLPAWLASMLGGSDAER